MTHERVSLVCAVCLDHMPVIPTEGADSASGHINICMRMPRMQSAESHAVIAYQYCFANSNTPGPGLEAAGLRYPA